MDKRFKDLTVELVNDSINLYRIFMKMNLNEEESIRDVLNLIISSHLSSLSITLLRISEYDDTSIKQTKKFIDSLNNHLIDYGFLEKTK